MKFRKKPVIIDAVKYLGSEESYASIVEMGCTPIRNKEDKSEIRIITLEGTHHCRIGDWVIRGVKGEFYPCKPDIFEITYEKAE